MEAKSGGSGQVLLVSSGVVAGLVYMTVPYSRITELVLFDGMVLLALAAAALGAWRARATWPTPWLLLTFALAAFLAGELTWLWFLAHDRDPFPSVADLVYLVGYVFLGMCAWVLASGSTARDRLASLDAGILSVAVGAFLWVGLVQPYASDPTLDALTKFVTIAYPVADLFVFGFVLSLLLSRGGQTRAVRLFAVGVSLTLGADIAFSAQDLAGAYAPGSVLDMAWILGYAFMAAAALDRSAGHRPQVPADHGLGKGRLAAVLLAVAAPQLLLLEALGDEGLLGATVPAIAAVTGSLVSILIGLRLWSLLGRARRTEATRGGQRLAAVVEHLSDAVVLLRADGSITYASPAVHLWGHDPQAAIGTTLIDWLTEADRAGLERQLASLIGAPCGTEVGAQGQVIATDGSTHAVEGTIRNLLEDPAVGAIVVTLTDVSERQELEAQLRRKAFHDDLTGLANRELFTDRLQHALRRARRQEGILGVVVMFIDLDDFKAVNDGLGHAAGDELLRNVSDRIRLCVRPADTVARLGGDEFAILLEDLATLDEAANVAKRVLEMLMLPVRVLDSDIAVPASIGVAPRTTGCSAESLLRDADIAMYSAKAFGKGRVEVFDDDLRVVAQRRLKLRIELPSSFAAGEFRVAYQPLHFIADHRVTGFEALLRWDHPEHGSISPIEFIPAAEGCGFILELGRYVLSQACAQAAEWNRRSPHPLTINVNVSGVQLHHGGFSEVVKETLAVTGLEPSLLTLELTESVLIDHERIGTVLTELRELGIGIAIDDFGTGYSSLSYLHQFPITSVKIDRSFVSQLTEKADANLVRSILGIADALGLKAVAEGVENPEQLDALGTLGCQVAQGFYLGKPQTPQAIDTLLARKAALPPNAR
ncbi:MAG: EAL domain-containing protein [Candidatus Nanopelagicales bacterium]